MTDTHIRCEAFIREFRSAEYALKRSGFRRLDRDVAEADWDRFAQTLGPNSSL